ncbi:MAG TPA: hypothetical protein VM658_04585 [bacterium]|nr:hypothetical protein [bacterium]
MIEKDGRMYQKFNLSLPLPDDCKVEMESSWGHIEAECKLNKESQPCAVFAPACEEDLCKVSVTITTLHQLSVSRLIINQPRQRHWTIFMSPFSHIDIGFTNSQQNILARNLDNLRAALDLIERTRDYPEGARFRFFTEVSYPLSEFLFSDAMTQEEKDRMVAALKSGAVEAGGFYISHQDKFMPAEALFRSTDPALRISREYGVPINTACLNDLTDASAVTKPLSAAGITYFIAGTNTTHYIAPPLFYLQPPAGNEKILVWLGPNLNGYGENFDFLMRPELPISDAAISAIESRLGPYLKSLETDGAPPAIVREHYDFFGAKFPYPYDFYFLPYYPAHAVDNGPQDITPSELARAWNQRYAWPRLVIANPSEFFAHAQAKSNNDIPTLRGDLPGFWGEQIFFAFAQVDPQKEAAQREFERDALTYEMASAYELLQAQMPLADLSHEIAYGFKLTALNNDHNPGPVPFGNTKYTKQDTADWKQTRRDWIAAGQKTAASAFDQARQTVKRYGLEPIPPVGQARAVERDDAVVLENEFYRVEVDKKTGGVRSLFDKELNRELAAKDGAYFLNQYVVVARGEDAGIRGNVFSRPGFAMVKVQAKSQGPENAVALVTGRPVRNPDEVKTLTRFIKDTFGIPVPGFLIRTVTPLLKVKLGPVDEVTQEIELRAGEKAVYFTQHIKTTRDQAIDHTFAYPLNVPRDRPLIVEGPYNPYTFAPGPPIADGDLVPAARMTDPKFPGINALTQVFGWIYGMPADAVFRSYVLAMGDGFGVAFSSRDSGAILPGPLDKDPVRGPFGGGFHHLVLGWTAYGHAFLGAPREGDYSFTSALTSFPAHNADEAKAKAARFGRDFIMPLPFSGLFQSSNSAVLAAAVKPLDDDTLMMRLYETSGAGAETTITIPGTRLLYSASRARSDGEPLAGGELSSDMHSFPILLAPGEIATVRLGLVKCPFFNQGPN